MRRSYKNRVWYCSSSMLREALVCMYNLPIALSAGHTNTAVPFSGCARHIEVADPDSVQAG